MRSNVEGTTVIVVHPHPSMGGDSTHPLVIELAERLGSLGASVVTPDFHDPDVATSAPALQSLAESLNSEQLVFIGYSWGSIVTSHAMPDGLIARVLIAPPASMQLGESTGTPTLVLIPEHDQFGDPDAINAAFSGNTLVVIGTIPGADHFLWGSIEPIAQRCVDWLQTVV